MTMQQMLTAAEGRVRTLEAQLADNQRSLQELVAEHRKVLHKKTKMIEHLEHKVRTQEVDYRSLVQETSELRERVEKLEDERVTTIQRYVQEIRMACTAMDNRLRHLDIMDKYTLKG